MYEDSDGNDVSAGGRVKAIVGLARALFKIVRTAHSTTQTIWNVFFIEALILPINFQIFNFFY